MAVGVAVYRDREEAGEVLARHLGEYRGGSPPCLVLAIPNGGVPVGLRVADALGADFGLLPVRKLHIPWEREAGFGAVAPDGTVVFNEPLRAALGLGREAEGAVIAEEMAALRRRAQLFGAADLPPVAGRPLLLVDDGLASGYSMKVAVLYGRRRRPREVVVAVPTASRAAVELVAEVADRVVCPNIRGGPVFAVADAYREWRDLGDEEVAALLRRRRP